MNTHILRAEAFITAIRTLPRQEKRLIAEELISDFERDFTNEEWSVIERLRHQKGKIYNSAKDFMKAVKGL